MGIAMTPTSPLERAIERAGGERKLAERIGTYQQRVNRAKLRGVCPAEWVLPIERETGISRHELRPDIYPEDAAATTPSPVALAGEAA